MVSGSASAIIAMHKRRLEEVSRRAYVELAERVVERTPVESGTARASWTPTLGAPVAETQWRNDAVGGFPQRASVEAVARALRPGDSASFVNNAPYARVIEFGWAGDRLPVGMVRRSVAEWQAIVDGAVREVRR